MRSASCLTAEGGPSVPRIQLASLRAPGAADPASFLEILAQVSLSVTVRLNTGAPGRESGSAQK